MGFDRGCGGFRLGGGVWGEDHRTAQCQRRASFFPPARQGGWVHGWVGLWCVESANEVAWARCQDVHCTSVGRNGCPRCRLPVRIRSVDLHSGGEEFEEARGGSRPRPSCNKKMQLCTPHEIFRLPAQDVKLQSYCSRAHA